MAKKKKNEPELIYESPESIQKREELFNAGADRALEAAKLFSTLCAFKHSSQQRECVRKVDKAGSDFADKIIEMFVPKKRKRRR